ncbi:2Fe-2S iron-sulfur cluster binding domain-containing protein [Parasulfuritortus cantonensis]|uniref:2Fe-2S iron-sulfur cluster binding domain-containing protein n=1 Tax=Parasulfuritortus cantonensis TaxID=2528202 RepID=A0A4R1BEK7_9PROT|nr:2Fe-2S iron-sulfur cluster-binding protein [Parasulfuritortus cantonensis]TCJ15559.1 2Fe-2S iron-sulfur cluster binding domain-containing protein [Parasulfuritortus cantonensis]
MTAQELLLLILLGLFVQLLVYAGVGFYRHWLAYLALRQQAGARPGEPVPEPEPAPPAAAPAWPGWRPFRVVERRAEDRAGQVCSFLLAPVDGQPLPACPPGRFLTFRLDVEGAAKPLVRCYSLSEPATPAHYRVTVKRVPAAGPERPPGRASNHFHDRVRVGDVLAVQAPSGHFQLDCAAPGPVVLVAGGIGITPLYSMLCAALAARPEREVWLFYGVRDGREMVFGAALAALAERHANLHLHVCFSRPGTDDVAGRDYRHAGRVDIARLRLELPLKPFHFYVCGPGAMMASLLPALAEWGVAEARLHYEAFGPASLARPVAGAPAAGLGVRFERSGVRADWQAGSLLELAEASGVKVESGCRLGCCGACQTAILAGEVAYEQHPEYEVEAGSCLLCLARPRTELVLDA